MAFGFSDQVIHKIGIAPQGFQTLNYITRIKFKSFAALNNLMALELGPPWQLVVDDLV